MIVRSLLLALAVFLLSCSSNQKNKTKEQKDKGVSSQVNEAKTESIANSEMIYFEGGSFMMGSDKGTPQEKPVHQVEVKSFKIDKHPVTVGDFRRFIEATKYQTDADRFGDSGVFDFNTSGWVLVPRANWQYPMGNCPKPDSDHYHYLGTLAEEGI